MSLSPYLMNVALHAVIFTAVATVLLHFLRKPVRRSFAALAGLLAAGVLAWFTPAVLLPDRDSHADHRPLPAASPIRVWQVASLAAPPPGPVEAATSHAASPRFALPSWRVLAAWTWLSGSAISLGLLLVAGLRLGRWQSRLSRPDAAEQALLGPALPAGLEMASIRLSDSPASPCVAGLFRPLLVMPRAMLATATHEEVCWTLRHEHRHLLGMDSRWTFLHALLRGLFWWNPLIHHLAIRWGEAREQVCDLHATAAGDRSAYSELLVRMAAENSTAHLLAAPMLKNAKRGLRKRIVALLATAPEESNSPGPLFCSGTLVVLLAAILFTSAFGVAEQEGGGPLAFAGPMAQEPALPENPQAQAQPVPQEKLRHLQLKFAMTVLFTPRAVAKNQAVLTPDAWQKLLEETQADRQCTLLGFPEITCRDREQGLIEIIRENPTSPDKHKAGWQVGVHPEFDPEHKQMTLSLTAEYGFVPGAHYAPTSKVALLEEQGSGLNWSSLVTKKGAAKAPVAEGCSLVVALGEVVPGWHATLFTRVDPIDATGRLIERYEDARLEQVALPEQVPVTVRVRGILLEDFDPRPIEGDEGLSAIGMIFNAEEWKLAKDQFKGTALGEFVLESGKEAEPWKELPGVKLAVSRNKGEPHVTLEFITPFIAPWNPKIPGRYAITANPGMVFVSYLPAGEGARLRGLVVVLEAVK